MTYLDILEKWGIYSEYDSDQKAFNLLSVNYHLHQVGKIIEMLLSEYDSTGMLAVIYAKIKFEILLKQCSLSVWDVLTNPASYKEEKEMLALFNQSIVTNAENEFIEKLNRIYLQVTNGKLIGEDDGQRKQLLDSLERVVESVEKCNVDLFKKGGQISPSLNVHTKLHIFNTLAECLLRIEKAPDGIYFCFIRACDSADCFFTFFLKSNGTLLSVNDRVDEAYIGQHGNLRNGRWTESKVSDIFPYDFIFHYSEHDYKGYAEKYELDEESLEHNDNETTIDLYNFGIDAFMPIIIATLLISCKYSSRDLEMPLHYIDSFLPANQCRISSHELMVLQDSSIVEQHNQVYLDFDNQKLLAGDYAKEFHWSNETDSKETGYFTNDNQLMVDLWGDGFVFDPAKVFQTNNITCLMDKGNDSYISEFVGTEKRMRLQIYTEARKQLADYIEDKIYQAWVDFGKTEAVREWYINAVTANKEVIYRMLMEYEEAVENGTKKEVGYGWRNTNGDINIYITRDSKYPNSRVYHDSFIGCTRDDHEWKWICDVTGTACNIWFVIAPQNWEQLAFLTNAELPKIVKGWQADSNRPYSGNHLLDATDAVSYVKTPCEHKDAWWGLSGTDDKWKNAHYDFELAFGFSKRGWNKIKKELKQTQKM